MAVIKASIPEKLGFLFHGWRYKVAHGGRGSGKSWSFARALVLLGLANPVRVLCTREVQKSIKDSVHRLISDQIEKMGLSGEYTILETEIRGKNGTQFLFSGLSSQTADSIKSFEGVSYCWCEEAQSISKRSWDILIPTIRKEGSEIWITFNPDLETDETYQRFVVNKPDNCCVVKMDYGDNPWFPDVLELERLRCKKFQPDDYDTIWEGKCRPAAEGAIYYKEMESAQGQGRICNVPYDPMLKAHVVFDIGWNDCMAISIVQRGVSDIRVIKYVEDSHKTLDYYSSLLKDFRYNWGKCWLPHDGYAGDVKTGKTCADIMRKLGWDVPKREEIAEMSVENGIKVARMTMPRVYFDKNGTDRLIECLKRYKRSVSSKTMESGSPLHDAFSHGADNFRYVCINADKMANSDSRPRERYRTTYNQPVDAAVGY